MELETAARRMFLADTSVQGYVTGKVYKFELLDHVSGTSGRAIVVRRASGWGAPPLVGSSEYPTLIVENWADASRTPDGEVLKDDAADNALALYRVTDALVHGARDVVWGAGGTNEGLRIVTAVRDGEPAIVTASASYGGGASTTTPRGDSACAIASYSLHIA